MSTDETMPISGDEAASVNLMGKMLCASWEAHILSTAMARLEKTIGHPPGNVL
jgi:hypothetical protein